VITFNSMALVLEFQKLFDSVNIPNEPGIPNERTCLLRLQLITEELSELEHAFCARDLVEVLDALTDLQYVIDGTTIACGLIGSVSNRLEMHGYYRNTTGMKDSPRYPVAPLASIGALNRALTRLSEGFQIQDIFLVEAALVDLNQSLLRAYYHCGMVAVQEAAFREVHRSNMSKAGDDGKPVTDGAGRVVKGPNYSPPDLAQFLLQKAA
jgi:predicted HAD superfamily Cof-like phosphohydrolase